MKKIQKEAKTILRKTQEEIRWQADNERRDWGVEKER